MLGIGASGSVSATGSVANAPPAKTDTTYATLGRNSDAPVATLFGNFKCPYTRKFVENGLSDVISKFVEPGHLQLRYRQLAYEPYPNNPSHGTSKYFISNSDPRIGRVALGVWDVDPDSYWPFFKNLFDNQPSGWFTYEDLRTRMNQVDVSNQDRVIKLAKSDRYSDQIHATTQAFHDFQVHHTPRFSLEGDVTNPRWNLTSWLNEHLSTSGGSASQASTNSQSKQPESSKNTGQATTESTKPQSTQSANQNGGSNSGNQNSGGNSSGFTPDREMSVVGTGNKTRYRFTISGGARSTGNTEGSDTINGKTVTGTVRYYSDNYEIAGEITSFDVLSGDDQIDVWVAGTKKSPSDF